MKNELLERIERLEQLVRALCIYNGGVIDDDKKSDFYHMLMVKAKSDIKKVSMNSVDKVYYENRYCELNDELNMIEIMYPQLRSEVNE